MIKRVTIILVLGFLVAITAFIVMNWPTVMDEIDELIRRELPKGSSKAEVYDFLDSRAIISSGYQVGPDPIDAVRANNEEKKRYVTASIPIRSWMPFQGDSHIRIVFYFDEEGSFIEHKLRRYYDVP